MLIKHNFLVLSSGIAVKIDLPGCFADSITPAGLQQLFYAESVYYH
jgi:hypothetical protein